MTPKALPLEGKFDIPDFLKIKRLCCVKNTAKTMKKQVTDREKIPAGHTASNGLGARTWKELWKHTSKHQRGEDRHRTKTTRMVSRCVERGRHHQPPRKGRSRPRQATTTHLLKWLQSKIWRTVLTVMLRKWDSSYVAGGNVK